MFDRKVIKIRTLVEFYYLQIGNVMDSHDMPCPLIWKNTISRLVRAAVFPLYSGIGSDFLFSPGFAGRTSFSNRGQSHVRKVTPEFLEDVIQLVRSQNYDIVSLDAAVARIGRRRRSEKVRSVSRSTTVISTILRSRIPFSSVMGRLLPSI